MLHKRRPSSRWRHIYRDIIAIMTEGDIQNTIRMFMSNIGIKNWRNNTGTGWVGNTTRLPNGDILIKNPRPLHAGLCKGSSDIIGITPVFITPEMVGETLGVFTAIEVKTPRGKTSEAQELFIKAIRQAGGYAGVARCPDDVEDVIQRWQSD